MPNVLKVLLAFVFVVFFLALGAFGGCLAGVAAQETPVLVVGIIGGAIAGIWFGIWLARKVLWGDKSGNNTKQ